MASGISSVLTARMPIARHAIRVTRSIRRSTTRLVVATVLVTPIAAGKTSARMTSPRRSGRTLFSAIAPRKGAAQFRKLTAWEAAESMTDHLKMRTAYPKASDAIPSTSAFAWVALLLSSFFSNAPRSFVCGPESLELALVAQRIARLPEACVMKRAQLSVFRQLHQGLALPGNGVAVDVLDHFWFQHEETAVDPANLVAWFLFETGHTVVLINIQHAKAARWLNSRNGGQLAMLTVEGHLGTDVDVGQTVAVSQAERLVVQIWRNALQASAGHGFSAGIDQRDAPVFSLAVENLRIAGGQIDSHVRHVAVVVKEELFNDVTLVAQANNEILDPVIGVATHDVPQQWLATDFYHRLWFS
nr:hypothetical protein [Tanacetum cinerariifolium]